MPIDASIALQGRLPQIESPLNAIANVLKIKGAQQQSQLGELQLAEHQRTADENKAVNSAFSSALGPDGKIDRNRLYSTLATSGYGAKLPVLQKGFADQDKAAAEQKKAEIDAHLKKFEVAGQIMTGVTDQASWERAIAQTAQVFGPEAAAQMPTQYDPALVEQKRIQALGVKDQLEQQGKEIDRKLNAAKFGEEQRHNVSSERLTARGQTLTDSRARDFNAIQVEANNIKRGEKKETADLTRNSQIASFDTMLGTLDRLAKHPGLHRSVGAVGAFPTMPGSDSANFQAELNTFQSQAFLPMVAQLKGMGALSDAEGKKLTAAVGALDPKMGETAFRSSIKRITDDMKAARERLAGSGRKPKQAAGANDNAGASVIDFGSLK